MLFLVFGVFSLPACTSTKPDEGGYFPIPNQFTGIWIQVSPINRYDPISITQTATGAIIIETYQMGAKHKEHVIQRETILKVFSIQGNRIYAIGKVRVYNVGDAKKRPFSSPNYYSLKYTPPDKPFDSYGSTLYLGRDYFCFPQELKLEDFEKSSSFHLHKTEKERCNKPPLLSEEGWSGDSVITTPYRRYR